MKTKLNIGISVEEQSITDEQEKILYATKKKVDYISNVTVLPKAIEPMNRYVSTCCEMLDEMEQESGEEIFKPTFCSIPIYEAVITGRDVKEVIKEHYDIGYRAMTFHLTPFKLLRDFDGIVDINSRGGFFLYELYMRGVKENPLLENLEWIENFCLKNNIHMFVGMSYRPGHCKDSLDAYQQECDYVDMYVNLSGAEFEIGGHMESIAPGTFKEMKDYGSIFENLMFHPKFKLFESNCLMGPLTSDGLNGFDDLNALFGLIKLHSNVTNKNAISTALIITRREHIGIPDVDDVKDAVDKYSVIKYLINLYDRDMTETMMEQKFLRNKNRHCSSGKNIFDDKIEIDDNCTMCGDYCPLKQEKESERLEQVKKLAAPKNKPILICGSPYSGKTTFAKLFVEGNDVYKYFSVGDYARKEMELEDEILTPEALTYILSDFKHDGYIIDNPFKTEEQIDAFHSKFDLNNYLIFYVTKDANPKKELEPRENRKDDKYLKEKSDLFWNNDEEEKILSFMRVNNIRPNFISKIQQYVIEDEDEEPGIV